MENENTVSLSLSRRRVIADFLKIPPILLGLSVIGSDAYLMPLENAQARPRVSAYSVEEASDYLNTAWEINFYTASSDILPGVRRWIARVEEQVSRGGPEQERNLDLLHQYKHFLLMVGRDRQEYAGTDPVGLIQAAEQLEDHDALGISLYRRGKMYFQQRKYKEAIDDVQAAIQWVDCAGPQVKGLVLVGCGSVLAHYAEDKGDVDKIRKNLDRAWECVESAKGYPDPFRAKFDESWYYVARASSTIPLLRFDPTLINEVWEALDLAREKTKPQYVRRKANIDLLYSEAAFHAGEYLSSVSAAMEALELAQAIELAWNIEGIEKIYKKLTQTKIKDSRELRELGEALLKK